MIEPYGRRYRLLWRRHWWWRARAAWLIAWVERLHRRAPRHQILDVGCGNGLFFPALRRFGAVEGIEPEGRLVRSRRWRSAIRVEPLSLRVARRGPYDLVLMLDVLEHIDDDAGALESARAALRPGGHLLLTVPALSWLWSRHDEANHHFRRYDRRSLRRRLEGAGFVVEELRYFYAWTVGPLLVRRWAEPAGRGAAEHEVALPPRWLNRALEALSRAELAVSRRLPWPIGSSLLAIARRPEAPATGPDFAGRALPPAAITPEWGAAPSPTRSPMAPLRR